MQITNATILIGRRANGSTALVLGHGGLNLRLELGDADRIAIGRALLEPLYECVPYVPADAIDADDIKITPGSINGVIDAT